jgi:outer membrane lipase/esterase
MSFKTVSASILALGLSSIVLAGMGQAQSLYSSITIFGDSLSDTGNIPKLIGLNYPPPPYFQNQFSNGPVYANYLNGLFGISTPLNDLAIGGAKTGIGNVGGLPGNPAIGLPNAGMDGELDYYLQSHPTPSKSDLFIVWGGANDYLDTVPTFQTLGLSGHRLTQYLLSPTGPVTVAVGDLVTDVRRLAAIGVKNFVVPNLPDLGDTPLLNGNPITKAQGGQLADVHNQALASAMGALQQQLKVNITIVDVGAILKDIIADPGKYGIDPNHITQECILNAACVAQHQNYLFWDDVHPTGLIQQELSEAFFASLTGPTTVGPELDLEKVVQQDLFDHISARTTALRLGAAGLSVGNFGGAGGGDPDQPLSAFVTNSYGWGSRNARSSTVGFDYNQDTTTAGVDYRLNDWSAAGVMLGYNAANSDFKQSMGNQSVDSYEAAVYATAFTGNWYGSAAGTYVYNDWGKLDRNVFIGNQTAAATTSGHILGGKLEGGYVAQFGNLSIGPAVELRLADYRIGGYTEHGAVGLNQEVDGQDTTALIGQFGFQAAIATAIGDYAVIPQFRLNWDHDFRHASRAIVTRIASQLSTSVTTDIEPDSQDWVRFGAGVDVKLTDMFSALVDFDTTVGRGEDYDALVRLKARF